MNVIKCPNCGASSTNHTNCEYCGSLLVRFVDKGIDLSTTGYLTNDKVYAGLIDALKQNLDRQELSDSAVETCICYKSSPTVKLSRKRHGVATVFRSGSTTWSDGDPIKLGDKNRGLVIKFSFDIHAEGNDISDERIEKQHLEFKTLGSFPLFSFHSGIYVRPGSSIRFRSQEYAIDFGQDIEGAARLISEVLSKVYGIPEDVQLIYLNEEEPFADMRNENTYKEEQNEIKAEEPFGDREIIYCIALIGVAIVFICFGYIDLQDNALEGISLMAVNICVFIIGLLMMLRKFSCKYFWPTLIACCLLNFGIFYLAIGSENNDAKTEQKAQTPQQIKQDRKSQLSEEAYRAGSDDARSSGSVEDVQDLLRSGYGKDNIRGMQKTQGRLNYKEEYGEPKTSEEKELQELYGEKYAEGFMKTMFKD